MKSGLRNILFLTLLVAVISGCCGTKTVEYKTTVYVPVYKNLDAVRNGIKTTSGRELKNTGKIYIYGHYILINELKEGIHIIDNTNPKSPNNVAFIEIPGNGDMAVKNNILYADSYIDLVAIDISNPVSPQIVKRIEEIFPQLTDGNGNTSVDPKLGLLVEYVAKDTIISYTYSDCGDNVSSPIYYNGKEGGMERSTTDGSGNATTDASSNGNITGKGGSMARFTLLNNNLYTVDGTSLQIFDVSKANDPKVWSKLNIGWNIETIYPFKNRLFIGSTTGMFIYDVSSPLFPVQIGQFQHARACDPVVADDKYAYVTLRTGTRCGGSTNQLDVLDITDLSNPKLLKSYPMQSPAGIGLDNKTLFLCDGDAGLKVFDVTKPTDMQLLDWKSDLKTYDVIPLGTSLLMIGQDGFYQYDYTNPKNLVLLSKIPVVK
jgi:hypothetical protein